MTEYDKALARECEKINLEFSKKYEFLGEGRHRRTYRFDSDTVVKVPHSRNYNGFIDVYSRWTVGDDIMSAVMANYMEHDKDEEFWGVPCAETRLEHYNGVPILYMEYVEPLDSVNDDVPDWAWEIDGGQVGYGKDGVLKAYDYSE